jgi:hypothetical protein
MGITAVAFRVATMAGVPTAMMMSTFNPTSSATIAA